MERESRQTKLARVKSGRSRAWRSETRNKKDRVLQGIVGSGLLEPTGLRTARYEVPEPVCGSGLFPKEQV